MRGNRTMKSITGWLAGLALAAVLTLPVQAQIAVAPGGVGGVAAFGGVGLRPGGAAIGGFGLSTVGGAGNPFFGTGSLSTSPFAGPYGLSTVPYTGNYIPPYAQPYYDLSTLSRLDPYSGYLQGLAAVTSATGQYHKAIQEAKITREQSRQMAYDTMRKRVQFEAAPGSLLDGDHGTYPYVTSSSSLPSGFPGGAGVPTKA
ncbi:MAG: adenylosuccinate synthetase, partial [Gemmataceae bacterium]|nr:adenylosuccinate synthetase [Gemmataceae bacterium]